MRIPSPLLEADPPRHDAPRRFLSSLLGPPALARLREREPSATTVRAQLSADRTI
ncbi:hypothetical protein [Actinacidiphila oryziradicis]|uniref:hypothetical protein n=1 Tax=Actinacidiphila oryziradicis TaxID=2571141 RepID=UPI001B805147|nr:hypothetical protein [Actinacidiphila oryziradicis]